MLTYDECRFISWREALQEVCAGAAESFLRLGPAVGYCFVTK